MKSAKPFIGIYDELILQRQLLHNSLERMQYEILYSCSCPEEFIQNFLIHPVDIILVSAEKGLKKSEEMLKAIGNNKKFIVLFYYGCMHSAEAERINSQYKTEVFFCGGTWEDVIISLDSLIPGPEPLKEIAIHISADSPFYKIACNKTCVRILELLREGKNVKQISAITRIPDSTVNYHLKKMRQETGCASVVELVMDAKETGVL